MNGKGKEGKTLDREMNYGILIQIKSSIEWRAMVYYLTEHAHDSLENRRIPPEL
jgi:hypothetical protein